MIPWYGYHVIPTSAEINLGNSMPELRLERVKSFAWIFVESGKKITLSVTDFVVKYSSVPDPFNPLLLKSIIS